MDVIGRYAPDEAAVEETFVNKNPSSTLKLGLARGVALLVPARADLPVAEYAAKFVKKALVRSEEHTSELQSLMRISYAVFCLKKKKKTTYESTRQVQYI